MKKLIYLIVVIVALGLVVSGWIPTIPKNSTNLGGEGKSSLVEKFDIEISYSPESGIAPLTVQFEAWVTGGIKPYTYHQWDFGDGTPLEEGTGVEYSNPSHVYAEPGKYKATLYVEDANGNGVIKRTNPIIVGKGYDKKILDIPYFSAQGVPNGCGCAAGAMIMNYYNYLDVEPGDLAPYIMVPGTKWWPTFGLLAGIVVYIKYYDYDENLKTKLKILTIEDIKRKIDEGFPVAVLQYAELPRITKNLHYRVVHGYDDEKLEFTCSCAFNGENYPMDYSEFINLNILTDRKENPIDKCPSLIVAPKNMDIYVDVVPTEGNVPHEINLEGYVRAVVSPFYCQVDFGDGTPLEEGIGNEFLHLYHTYTNEGKFTPVLYVEDNLGRKGKYKAEDVIVVPLSNQSPEILSLTASPESLDVGENSTITCDASDPDGDALTYDWSAPDGGTISGSGSSVIWTAPGTAGLYPVICTVSDGRGGSDEASISIEVTDSLPDSTNKLFLQSGGALNGTSINPSNPVLTVNSGGSITGTLKVQAIYTGPSNNVVPFGYTPSWGSHSGSYVTVDGWIPVGTSTYTVPINLIAPNDAGTYYLIFATNCEMNLGWTMSQTNWTTGTMSWDDGYDIADLTE